tara:strand:- start:2759 stop:3646 length:888 start_codon:yes stop_codon:yes gene_type:complete
MNSNLDLEIDNYNLEDLLNLFNLDINFDQSDLKTVKQIVLKTHPDRSGLDKSYFLFYGKAYKVLQNLYEFKNKKNTNLNKEKSKIDYLALSDEDKGKKLLVENLKNTKKNNEFNKWFNEVWEKVNIKDEDGYGDWFTSNDDLEETSIKSVRHMHEKITQKKENLSQIVRKSDINEICSIGDTNELDSSKPEYYSSNLFSKLQYDDLKKSYTETVIPVSNDDYENKQKFSNVNQLTNFRNNQNLDPLSKKDEELYFKNKARLDDKKNIELAYKLNKQYEESERANNKLWNYLRRLK